MLISRHRHLTTLERLVGVPRARMLRRRFGWLLIGAGVAALRPRRRISAAVVWMVTGLASGLLLGQLA